MICSPSHITRNRLDHRFKAKKKVMFTLPETNSSHLKNGGWKTILSYWVWVTFQGRIVKLRGGGIVFKNPEKGVILLANRQTLI